MESLAISWNVQICVNTNISQVEHLSTLKYLEIKIEEWPSRDKWGQVGPNKAKKDLTGPNVAKRAKRAKRGQMGSNGADFLCARIFYETKNSCLATQALRLKLAELWQYCYFLGYHRLSLKALSLFLYLSEEIFFYIIWKLMYIALFWAVALIFWVPPSWLKIDFKSILSHFLDLRPFYAMKGAPKNLKPRLKIKLYK